MNELTPAQKLQNAINWLKSRDRYALDLKHTRQRWTRMLDKQVPPPQQNKIRKIA